MNRETISFETSSGHKVETKTYATARESIIIQEVYLRGAKMEFIGGASTVKEVSPTIQFEVEKKMIEVLVVSIDGQKENLVEVALELPNTDYQEILSKIDTFIAKKNN